MGEVYIRGALFSPSGPKCARIYSRAMRVKGDLLTPHGVTIWKRQFSLAIQNCLISIKRGTWSEAVPGGIYFWSFKLRSINLAN